VSLYDFYLKVDKVKDDMNNGTTSIRHQHDVNASNDMEVNDMLNTLARFKKYLEEKDSLESRNGIESYLIDGCENLNENRLNIWAGGSIML
jgi:hypothetical protein